MIDYEGMIVLHEDLFQFDKFRENLTEYNKPENTRAVKDLQQREDIVWGFYHSPTSRIYNVNDYAKLCLPYEELKHFRIPKPILSRGYELAEEVLMKYNQKSLENRDGFQYVTALLSRRFNGEPAEMRIDGISYIIDLKKMEIRKKGDPLDAFVFPPSAIDTPTKQLYNTQTKKPVKLAEHLKEYSEHVICFTFPKLNALDPIGYCLVNGYPPTWLVTSHQWDARNFNVPWKCLEQSDIDEMALRTKREQLHMKKPSKKKKPNSSKQPDKRTKTQVNKRSPNR